MKTLSLAAVAVLLFVGFTIPAAAETKLTGTVSCAKCVLKKADAAKCQDVLVVKDENGASTEYYLAKNDTVDNAGHVCSGSYKATVTGEVAERDGKKWVTATKIEKQS